MPFWDMCSCTFSDTNLLLISDHPMPPALNLLSSSAVSEGMQNPGYSCGFRFGDQESMVMHTLRQPSEQITYWEIVTIAMKRPDATGSFAHAEVYVANDRTVLAGDEDATFWRSRDLILEPLDKTSFHYLSTESSETMLVSNGGRYIVTVVARSSSPPGIYAAPAYVRVRVFKSM